MKKDHEKKLNEPGLSLPALPAAADANVPGVRTGGLVFCSGQGPTRDGRYARSAIGANDPPFNIPVEVGMVVEVEE